MRLIFLISGDFPPKKCFLRKKEKKYVDDLRKEKTPPHKIVDGVWLYFLPVMDIDEFGDDVVEELKVHLINRTYSSYKFYYRLQFFGKSEFELKNQVNSFADFYLHDVPFSDMSDSPVFTFEFSLVQPEKTKADFYETSLKIKPKQLFEKIEEIKKKGEATFSYRLFEHYPDKPPEEKREFDSRAAQGIKIYNAKEATKHLPPPRTVVDLHIEKLMEDWHKLSNGEILNVQLKEFEKWYELSVAHRQSHLIVVHGVGSGRLRDEIHDILRLKREVKSFVNQYHPSFGYGATEIYFQY